jgi:cytidine deaminase
MSFKQFESGHKEAVAARKRAYAPYSKYLVGCALKLKKPQGGKDFVVGCNVENASFGATICAERSAVTSMISQYGSCEIEYISIVTDGNPPAYPCGMCLQVLSEFVSPNTPVILGTPDGIISAEPFSHYLPKQFKFERK